LSQFFEKELAIAIAAAQDAAKIVMDVYATDFAVDYKHAREPVTVADRRVNDLLCDRISKAFPSDAIVAEESCPKSQEQLANLTSQNRVWFIDPLDGTKEFISRNGEFAVMIGLAIDGDARLGIVATPIDNKVWVGVVGQGAYVLENGSTRELHVSKVDSLTDASLLVSRSHRPDNLLFAIHRLGVKREVACGSVGVKNSKIALGEADLYVNFYQQGGAKLWDGCAPEALLRAAGGAVTGVSGNPINYASSVLELADGMVCSNGRIHNDVIRALKS
jgi:3'(2'), 5'-bisphosphate nucleotidase